MIAGRYTLEREIGRGGAGTVHLGRDEVLGRAVAIKRIGLMPGADTPDLRRAEREARLAASLNHPNVVAVFDLVEEDNCHWLVMEYVEGRTLAELVRAEGPLPAQRAAALLAQAADALIHAHTAGVVHRDVKPSNILVTTAGEAKLGDFGIARGASDVTLTQTGLLTGSPAYLAPEVASGATADTASDVWSLGATLFHATTGHPPYEIGGNLVGALYKIVHDDPPRLALDHPLAGLLGVTMVKDRDQRWPMDRVRDELRRVARGEAPTAPRPGPLKPTSRGATSTPAPQEATALLSAAPTGSAPRDRWRQVAAGLAVLAILAVGWVVFDQARQPDQDPTPPAGTSQPTDPGEESVSNDPAEIRREMEQFISAYLGLVTSDPRTAFSHLTPEFQAESGGFDGYTGWWGRVESARLERIDSDPEDLTVDYTVRYVMTNGRRQTQRVSLQLVRHDDGYLISGEG